MAVGGGGCALAVVRVVVRVSSEEQEVMILMFFGFPGFRQISPMLTYIWTVRSIFLGMLMSRGVAGARGGSPGGGVNQFRLGP